MSITDGRMMHEAAPQPNPIHTQAHQGDLKGLYQHITPSVLNVTGQPDWPAGSFLRILPPPLPL